MYFQLKDKFKEIYCNVIKRDGANKLLEYLETTDFFEAPASTRFHLCKKGGLLQHSLNVYERLKEEVKDCDKEESMAVTALLHDVCKANYYKTEYRNAKNELGIWEKVPCV